MKLAALLLLFALVGKMGATPYRYPVRLAFYRAAAPVQNEQALADDDASEEELEVSDEVNFDQDVTKQDDDDDDSDEQEDPPEFTKLFPLPQANSPGYNLPLTSMMSEIYTQGWKVPKRPQGQGQEERARLAITGRDDDDDDDDDSDEDEEEDEEDDDFEDDVPDWNTLFPNLEAEANAGPPAGLVDSSTAPEIPAQGGGISAFRSGLGGSRLVYVPARQLRQYRRPVPTPQTISRQYVVRNQTPPRSQVVYALAPSYMNNRRQYQTPLVQQRRPQQVMYASSAPGRRPQQQHRQQPYVMYMPVRRNSYSPYVSPYMRYRN